MCRIHPSAKERFLTAYEADPTIARACRAAGVHRSSVYRWQADPAFVAAMQAAWCTYQRAHLVRYAAEQAERQRWRAARELELRPMKLQQLATARAKKRRYQ